MDILIFTNGSLFVQTVSGMGDAYRIVGIVIPNDPGYDLLSTIDYAGAQQIPLLYVSNMDLQQPGKVDEWISALGSKAALVMTFPFKIPERILNIPERGFYNVHFSQLPAFKGPDPLFWQMKNGLKSVGLTVHKMTAKMDDGPLVFSQQLTLMSGETYGIARTRLTALLSQNLQKILQNIFEAKYLLTTEVIENSTYKRPQASDLIIDWEKHSAQEIENLVNAANPAYQGAVTYLSGQLIRIVEVSPVEGGFEPGATVPGTIFYVDQHHGPMVLTADKQLLLLNIFETEQGVFSGKKLCAMGLKQGDRFMN